MATNAVAKIPFSASTSGKGIKVVATATVGTAIHVTGAVSTVLDEVWMWAFSSHTADVTLTIEFGGVTAPDNNITLTIPFKQGLILVIPGLILQETGGALTIGAFASVANVVTISGFVNKITP